LLIVGGTSSRTVEVTIAITQKIEELALRQLEKLMLVWSIPVVH
jgi:hypothetical protein